MSQTPASADPLAQMDLAVSSAALCCKTNHSQELRGKNTAGNKTAAIADKIKQGRRSLQCVKFSENVNTSS